MKSKPLSGLEQKVEFLARHEELWDLGEGLVQKALVEAKLVSPNTYVGDINIPKLIKEAKWRVAMKVKP